ncbi:MAG: HAD-IA family hydrolase [Oscillospiraceae bacterium]|nr:HAD-IA family hydrolase [Oscillospiraceae bacterium]
MKYNTYIFDFDLTLADATSGIIQCYKKVLEKHNYPIPDDYAIKRTIGKTLTESFSIFTGITSPDILEQLRCEYVSFADEIMTENTHIFESVFPLVQALKKHSARIGIVTTKFAYRAIEALDKYNLTEYFDVIIGNENVKEYKPSPEGLNYAISQLMSEKSKVLYVGDTTIDAMTAANANVDFAAVLTGMTTKDEFGNYNCNYIFNDLIELCEELLK